MSIQYKNKFIPLLKHIETCFSNNHFDEIDKICETYTDENSFHQALNEYLEETKSFKQLFSREYDELFLERQCVLLRNINVSLASQIMHYNFPTRIEHIKAIVEGNRYLSGKYDNDILLNATSVTTYITHCFIKEKFDELLQLQQLFNKKLLNIPGESGSIGIETDSYIVNIYTSNIVYCPYHNIIYNYSKAKEGFLHSQNIALPTAEEATDLTHNIAINLPTNPYLKEITDALKYYNALMLHNEMQASLPVNTQTTKRAKI